MIQNSLRPFAVHIPVGLITLIALSVAPTRGAADSETDWVLKRAFGFVNSGGYFLTDARGRAAFGSPKFYSDGLYYVRPRRLGAITITGGGESMIAGDHLLPFSGGNHYELIGLSGEVSTLRHVLRPRYYLSGGLFYGELRSVNLNFDRSAFTPGVGIGVEFPVNKVLSFTAGYRVSQHISGYNTDGFSVSLRLH